MEKQGQGASSQEKVVSRHFLTLHGEYDGEEGRLAFADEVLFYGHEYVYDVCEQQGIIFQLESITPLHTE